MRQPFCNNVVPSAKEVVTCRYTTLYSFILVLSMKENRQVGPWHKEAAELGFDDSLLRGINIAKAIPDLMDLNGVEVPFIFVAHLRSNKRFTRYVGQMVSALFPPANHSSCRETSGPHARGRTEVLNRRQHERCPSLSKSAPQISLSNWYIRWAALRA